MTNVISMRREREIQVAKEQRQTIWSKLPFVEKVGGVAMTAAGSLVDMMSARDPIDDHISLLRRNAYKNSPNARTARRVWAGIAALTLTGVMALGGEVAQAVDDGLACSGETTAELQSGQNLTTLARTVTHENTPLSTVIDKIANDNPALVSENYITDSADADMAQPGTYKIPNECNSNL